MKNSVTFISASFFQAITERRKGKNSIYASVLEFAFLTMKNLESNFDESCSSKQKTFPILELASFNKIFLWTTSD